MLFYLLKGCRYFEKALINSWWVTVFIIVCYLCYEHGLAQKNNDFMKLESQHNELLKDKAIAEIERDKLQLQINSQSDPDWIELTLMKGLGLVPEGQIKVFFTEQEVDKTNYTIRGLN